LEESIQASASAAAGSSGSGCSWAIFENRAFSDWRARVSLSGYVLGESRFRRAYERELNHFAAKLFEGSFFAGKARERAACQSVN